MVSFRVVGQLSGVALTALCWSGIAAAQSAPAVGAPDQVAAAGAAPGDIIVTANKREQNLNDVGVTAAVVGGDALKQQNLTSLSDVATRIPSLSYAAAPNGTPVYTLRGVGFYETSIGAYPSVSIYTDEIPLSFPIMTSHSTFDLERLEVLNGPQGTLFGQNATGGAINYIVAKPTDTLQAGGSLTYGRFNQIQGEAYLSGPITDTLSARVAGRIETGDGWQISDSRPDDRNGKTRNYMGRLQIAFKPVDGLRLLLNVNGWKDKSETQAGQNIALQFQNENLGVPYGYPVGAFRNPAEIAAPFSPNNPRAADWSLGSSLYGPGKVPYADNDTYQVSLRADIDVGHLGTITSLSAYTRFNERQGNDSDGLPINALDVPLTLGTIKTFYQELRFANDPKNPFRIVLGANYEWDKVSQQMNIDYSASSAPIGFGTLFGLPLGVDAVNNDQTMRNYAFFGNVEYDVVPNLTLKGGLRYTDARDRANICQYDPQAPYNAGTLFEIFTSAYQGTALQPYVPGSCMALNVDAQSPANRAVDYLPYGAMGPYQQTLEEHNVSWKVGADYKLTPGTLIYFNVSKGYKAGSFPTVTATALSQYVPARQESVLAYEGGIKATLLHRALQFNLAGFYYDYRNKQLRTKLNDPTFGLLDVLRNIPKSSIKGFELELTARPARDLTFNAAYTYLDAKIDEFIGTNAGCDTGINFAGTDVPYTPRHQVAISANYNPEISSHLKLLAGATLNFRSSTIATLGGDVNPSTINATSTNCVYCIGDYALLDAQFGVEDADGRWRAFIWGKNITNTYYWTNVVSGYDTVSRFAGLPATYGVTVSYKFR